VSARHASLASIVTDRSKRQVEPEGRRDVLVRCSATASFRPDSKEGCTAARRTVHRSIYHAWKRQVDRHVPSGAESAGSG
jgi:hypothetical protein